MTTRQKKGEKVESTTYSGVFLMGIGVIALVLSVAVFFLVPFFMPSIYELDTPIEATSTTSGGEQTNTTDVVQETRATSTGPIPNYVPIPDAVRAIYMTQCVVGTPTFRADLVKLIDETELNAVIIDIKDYTGKLAFDTNHPDLRNSVSDQCGARDIKTFIEMLHSKGIYVMGRITVFQDPYYSSTHPELAVKFAPSRTGTISSHSREKRTRLGLMNSTTITFDTPRTVL